MGEIGDFSPTTGILPKAENLDSEIWQTDDLESSEGPGF
jgi:hypothetical protein